MPFRIQALAAVTFAFLEACQSASAAPVRATDLTKPAIASVQLEGMAPEAIKTAKWTFLVFMNGDNNLESFALTDFAEMAAVGSTSDVNVIVQLDRIKTNPHKDWDATDYGNWSQALRFRVTKGMEPTVANALPGFSTEVNMGDGSVLRDFVDWGRRTYPAEHYALVIWDHGAGWRLYANRNDMPRPQRLAKAAVVDAALARSAMALHGGAPNSSRGPGEGPVFDHPVKSVSYDETSGAQLFNRTIQDNLAGLLGDSKLDIIGFDACLMAMVETAYAMRGVAVTMIGSEELEPGDGWRYENILAPLVANPSMNGPELAKAIVDGYGKQYPNALPKVTLSAISSDRVPSVTAALDAMADALSPMLSKPGALAQVRAARNACPEYAPSYGSYHNIDLSCLAQAVVKYVADGTAKTRARALDQVLKSAVITRYANTGPEYVSSGMAVYFPRSRSAWQSDPLAKAYRNGLPAKDFPVQFVDDHRWDEFLAAYIAKVK